MSITLDEIYEEMDKLRRKQSILTQDQKEFILSCRDKNKGLVSYEDMVILWNKAGWGRIGTTKMARLCKVCLDEANNV